MKDKIIIETIGLTKMAALIERLQDVGTATKAKGMDLLDRQIPPQQRSELTANLRRFASQNPKLAVRQITSIAARFDTYC